MELKENGKVSNIEGLNKSPLWINGGFLVLRNEIFCYIEQGDELVGEPFQRLIREDKLVSYRYEGFWISMDTFKDKRRLDDTYARGDTPWAVWS